MMKHDFAPLFWRVCFRPHLFLTLIGTPALTFGQLGIPTVVASTEVRDANDFAGFWKMDNADLDGDGLKDILTVGFQGNDSIQPIWFKNLGDGTYSIALPAGGGLGSRTALAIDVNGDGLRDIIAQTQSSEDSAQSLNTSSGIGYYLNLGGGMFSSNVIQIDNFNQNLLHRFTMLRADLDGDSHEDLVVAMNMFNAGRRLWWYRNNGNGFAPAQVLISSGTPGINSIDVGDIDNDGDIDIAYCTDSFTSATGYLLNNGSGGFSAPVVLTGSTNSWIVKIVDVDMDGDEDIVSLYPPTRIFINDGNLQFTTHVDIPTNVGIETGDNNLAMTFMDINQDTYPDLIVSSIHDKKTYTYINDGNGTASFSPSDTIPGGAYDLLPIVADSPDAPKFLSSGEGMVLSHTYDDLSMNWSNTEISNEAADHPISFVDWDGDGLTDMLSCTDWGGVVWYKNEGYLAFSRSSLITTSTSSANMVKACDVDNDGDLDLVLIDHLSPYPFKIRIIPNLGTSWGSPLFQQTATYVSDSPVILLDLDNDGDIDLLYEVSGGFRYYLNNGIGGFTLHTMPIISGVVGFQMIDLNSDGLLDILCTAYGPNRLLWCQNMGAVGFGPATLIEQTVVPAPFVLSDMDGDGNKDIVYRTYIPDSVYWKKNTGLASFSAASTLYPSHGSPVSTYDINSDGLQDLLLVGDSNVTVARNLGGASFDPNPIYTIPSEKIAKQFGDYDWCADLDNDGDLELVFSFLRENGRRKILTISHNYSGTMAKGHVFVDENGNGEFDEMDTPAPFMDLILNPLGSEPLTDTSGSYTIYADPGIYDLQCPGPWMPTLWTLSTGASGYQFPLAEGQTLDSLDFGLTPLVDTSLVVPVLTMGSGPCGSHIPLWISYANEGTRIEHGQVQLALANGYGFISSIPTPSSVIDNLISWSFDSLSYFGVGTINAIVSSPTVDYIDDTLTSVLSVSTMTGGLESGNFTAEHTGVYTCSFDPNGKSVSPSGYGAAHAVELPQDHLDYTIHFQNTGTDTATNVIIRDQLSTLLDPTHLELLGYSHLPTALQVDANGLLEVRFEHIQLPDSGANDEASQGYITFRIQTETGLPNLTQITNSADIYFDLNEPVITDTTLTTLVDCDQWSPTITQLDTDLFEISEGESFQWFLNGSALPGETSNLLVANSPGSYTAQVTSQYGCVALSNEIELITTGIKEGSVIPIALVPNPFSTETRLLFGKVLSLDYSIDVIDVYGRVVQQHNGNGSNEIRIQRDQLSDGIYVVRISDGSTTLGSMRMVVQ